jgi:hypothetical protein
MRHADVQPGFIHTPFNWVYDDASDREGASGFTAGDIEKAALQVDTLTVWVLTAVDGSGNPTWGETGSDARRAVVAVPYAATVTPALPAGGDALYNVGTLTGPITIANPAGTPSDGQHIQFAFVMDATGGRAITWGSQYQFGSDVTPALIPTGANAKWRQLFVYNAAASKWQALAIARGF